MSDNSNDNEVLERLERIEELLDRLSEKPKNKPKNNNISDIKTLRDLALAILGSSTLVVLQDFLESIFETITPNIIHLMLFLVIAMWFLAINNIANNQSDIEDVEDTTDEIVSEIEHLEAERLAIQQETDDMIAEVDKSEMEIKDFRPSNLPDDVEITEDDSDINPPLQQQN